MSETSLAVTRLAPGADNGSSERLALRQAARAFESLFLQTLISRMREAQLEEGFFGGGTGSAIYDGLFEQHLGESVAERSPLGIAKLLEEQWTRGRGSEVEPALERLNGLRARNAYETATAASDGLGSASPAASPPRISRSYGWGNDPIDGRGRFHAGVDLAAPTGTPVLAIAPGRVVDVGPRGSYGLLIELEHAQGWRTRYAHLSGADVSEGQWVVRGQALGKVGQSGRATGPHLHFEARKNGANADPAFAAPGPLATQVLGSPADKKNEGGNKNGH